ncbi:hypothetical protein JCM11491_004303 [Sporobolomyces phaffii]
MSLARRGTHASRTVSHLLLAGHNPLSPPSGDRRQSRSNPSLAPVPFPTWLAQLGRERDTYDGPTLVTSVASSAGHSLVAYRNYSGVDRVVALGRNESGQLGIGFASQEPTRGLVEAFEGERVLKVATAVQASYLLVQLDKSRNRLYSFGNLSRGRLGLPHLYSRSPDDLDDGDYAPDPVARIVPRATAIVDAVDEDAFGQIVDVRTGYEHCVVLTESGDVFATGCNTDGQLGLGTSDDAYAFTRVPIPDWIRDREGGVLRVVAGADTTGVITHSGKLFTWGNSEYAQAAHGRTIDQLASPLEVAHETFLDTGGARRIVDYQCGGSFGVLLDDRHNVYTTGYGALGLARSPEEEDDRTRFNPVPTLVPTLAASVTGAEVTRIRAAYGYAAAIADRRPRPGPSRSASPARGPRMWTWGVNSEFGRLGLGTTARGRGTSRGDNSNRALRVEHAVDAPREVELPVRELGLDADDDHHHDGGGGESASEWEIGAVELGDEAMWVELREKVEVRQEEGILDERARE